MDKYLGSARGLFGGGVAGSLARLGIQVGAGTLMMKYSRDDESQADAVGAIIMYKAGYDPKALADLPAEEYSCFRGLYALVQLPRVAFNERRFKLILPIWKFRFEGMLSGPYFRLAFLPDCRERATERG